MKYNNLTIVYYSCFPLILCYIVSFFSTYVIKQTIHSYSRFSLCYVLKLLSPVWLFATLWTVAQQAPLSMGILRERILEWVAISASRGSSQPKDWTQVSHTAGRFFTIWATRDVLLLLLPTHFSCGWLCAAPEMAAHQAPPSPGFSRQEHWSGLPFPSPMHESEKWKWSCSVSSDS